MDAVFLGLLVGLSEGRESRKRQRPADCSVDLVEAVDDLS